MHALPANQVPMIFFSPTFEESGVYFFHTFSSYQFSKKHNKWGSITGVVDVEVDHMHGRPHVLRYVIDFRSSMLYIKIGYKVYNELR